MNKIRWTIVAIGILNYVIVNAQQNVMLTQYASALQLTNPAYVGTSGRLNATGIIRNQWVGFEGAPKSQVLMVNSPFLRYHLGIGLNLIRDEIGPTRNTLIYLNVAYNFNLNENVKLSMGLSGGVNAKKLDINALDPVSTSDPAYNLSDQVEFLPNFGTGVYIYSPKFYIGLSTPKLLKNVTKTNDPNSLTTGGEEKHFYLIGGYLFNMGEMWKGKPSFSIKAVKGAPFSVDLTANAIYNDKIWFGAMYRLGDAVGIIFQYQISEKLRAGYSYDLPLTEMQKNTTGSHEILISYDLVFKDRKIVTPRYF
ncbi:MAG: type IX secretion system membrane protein PorP/SprF [Bacteroidales bacterium]